MKNKLKCKKKLMKNGNKSDIIISNGDFIKSFVKEPEILRRCKSLHYL